MKTILFSKTLDNSIFEEERDKAFYKGGNFLLMPSKGKLKKEMFGELILDI